MRAVLSSRHAAFLNIAAVLRRPHYDVRTITTVVTEGAGGKPGNDPARHRDRALRARASDLLANSTTAGFEIVLGMPAWDAALADAGYGRKNWRHYQPASGGAGRAGGGVNNEPVNCAQIRRPVSALLPIISPQFFDR